MTDIKQIDSLCQAVLSRGGHHQDNGTYAEVLDDIVRVLRMIGLFETADEVALIRWHHQKKETEKCQH